MERERHGGSGEIQLPTKVLDRGLARPAGVILAAGGRVGAFPLIREVVRAPGIWLFETRHCDAPALLQIAVLRESASDAEQIARDHFERRLTAVTGSLLAEDPAALLAHGALDDPIGGRVLFWALPWIQRPLAAIPVRSAIDLAEIGLALSRRLARRHAQDRCDPHLTEGAVMIAADRSSSWLLGLPLTFCSEWLSGEMPATRLAPEEALAGAPTPSGDLWRLGQTLAVLGAELPSEETPPRLGQLIDRLRSGEHRRLPRATEVVVELEATLAEAAIPAAVAQGTVRLEALPLERLDALLLHATADSTRYEAASPIPEDALAVDDGRTIQAVTLAPPAPIAPQRIDVREVHTAEAMLAPGERSLELILGLPPSPERRPSFTPALRAKPVREESTQLRAPSPLVEPPSRPTEPPATEDRDLSLLRAAGVAPRPLGAAARTAAIGALSGAAAWVVLELISRLL
jgi:hypothetical protein